MILLQIFDSRQTFGITGTHRLILLYKKGKIRPTSKIKKAKNLLKTREKVIGTLLLGNNIVNILASALATSILINLFGDKGIIYATIIMTALIFIFAEVLPKTYAIRESERLVIYTSPIIIFFTRILSPINIVVQSLVSSILQLTNRKQSNNDWKQNLRGAILLANNQGNVRKYDRIMLESILDLHEIKVSEIKFDKQKELKKLIQLETNKQLNQFSRIYFNNQYIVG